MNFLKQKKSGLQNFETKNRQTFLKFDIRNFIHRQCIKIFTISHYKVEKIKGAFV